MKYILMFLTFAVGTIIPVQAVLNARLGNQVGGAIMGAFMSFSTGCIWLLLLNISVNSTALVSLKPMQTGPWYLWLGGLIGAIFVCYITWVNQRQGVGLTFALVISGQVFISLLIDNFGLFGSAIRTITLEKIIGAVFIIAGIILIKK
ncbi:MAG: DMT family transporter [Parafilimonas sp.]